MNISAIIVLTLYSIVTLSWITWWFHPKGRRQWMKKFRKNSIAESPLDDYTNGEGCVNLVDE